MCVGWRQVRARCWSHWAGAIRIIWPGPALKAKAYILADDFVIRLSHKTRYATMLKIFAATSSLWACVSARLLGRLCVVYLGARVSVPRAEADSHPNE